MRGKAVKHVRRNAIAYLALFVALGGSAYAAKKIGTKQLKRNAVTSQKIRNGTIQPVDTAPSLANGARNAKIVTRCRRTTPFTVTTAGFSNIPGFTGCTYSQPAGALDTFYPRAKISRPATCNGGEAVHIRVTINGGNLVSDFASTPSINPAPVSPTAPATFLLPVNRGWVTPEWDAPTTVPPWTLVPQAYDSCDANYTIHKLEIVVVRASG